MDAGQLTEQIDLQESQRVSDGMGGGQQSWVTVATVWARIAPLRGREQIVAQKEESRTVYRVTCYRDAVAGVFSTDLRVLWKTNGDIAMNIREDMDAGRGPMFKSFLAESIPAG